MGVQYLILEVWSKHTPHKMKDLCIVGWRAIFSGIGMCSGDLRRPW